MFHWILWSSIVVFLIQQLATHLNLKALPKIAHTDQEKKRNDYITTNGHFHRLENRISMMLFIAFWLLGGFRLIDEFSRSLTSSPIVIGLIALSILGLASKLSSLPFSYYRTFVIEEKFGFNQTKIGTFWADQLKGIMLSALLGLPLLACILWIFKSLPHAWLWAWVTITAFQLLMTYLAPTYLMPLFNKFTPMPDGTLKDKIQDLGQQTQFPLDGVFEMDGSKRSSKGNAFFTGIGKCKKIALFDTLIQKHSENELLAILAHEIGHFRCGHIRQRLVVSIIQTAVICFLLKLTTDPSSAFTQELFASFGVEPISTHFGLVFLMILFGPLSLILGIFSNFWSRKHEFEADAFAAQSTKDPQALIDALQKLSTDQLAHPQPHTLRVALDYSHPPLPQRLQALQKIQSELARP